MTTVTQTNIFDETWNIVHTIISGNITDPDSRNKKWVLGAFPNTEGKDFPDWPIIVIENPNSSAQGISFTPQGIVENTLDASVYVYSKSPQQLNRLCGSIYNQLIESDSVFLLSGLRLTTIDSGETGQDVFGNQLIHFKEQKVNLVVIS
jgi:hypothetical protein